MLIFFSLGRFGNQLFQYAFLKTIAKDKENIIAINMEDFTKYFNIKNKNFKNFSIKRTYIIKIIRDFILNFFVTIRLIGSIKQKRDNNIAYSEYIYKKGILPITLVNSDFFQSESFFKRERLDFYLKEEYVNKAKDFILSLNIPSNYDKCFIHVRRGDYLFIPFMEEKGINLPREYYINAIEQILKEKKEIFFIFLTDDIEFVKFCFQDIKNKVISNNDLEVDFAIMTLCEYGIISNSSFSWWGAYLMNNRKKIIAPKYWFGWKKRIEAPKGIHSSWMDIIEI